MEILAACVDLAAARVAGARGCVVCGVAVRAAGAAFGICIDALAVIEATVGACRLEAMPVFAVFIGFVTLNAAVAAVLGIRCKIRFFQAFQYIRCAAILIAGFASVLAAARIAPLGIRMCRKECVALMVAVAAVS